MKNKKPSEKDYVLVYSDDPKELNKCDLCEKSPCKCLQKKLIPSDHTIKIRLEKNARGGKVVTVLFELKTGFEGYFNELTKTLKNLCGTGGSFKDATIEIQGDHREKCKAYLEKLGFKVKLAGG